MCLADCDGKVREASGSQTLARDSGPPPVPRGGGGARGDLARLLWSGCFVHAALFGGVSTADDTLDERRPQAPDTNTRVSSVLCDDPHTKICI